MRRLSVLAVTAGLASVAGTLVAVSASAAPAESAPVVGDAKNGGAVIVWLKNQHSNLNLRTQSTQRINAAHTRIRHRWSRRSSRTAAQICGSWSA
jgi:hypothetical protein